MTDTSQRCVKCGSTMELGFVADNTYGGQGVSKWARGEPLKSFWTGVKKAEGSASVPIGTYRCSSCGYLESYARHDFAPK